jgi:hypothetical protein
VPSGQLTGQTQLRATGAAVVHAQFAPPHKTLACATPVLTCARPGWKFIGDRLFSATVAYEETGW